MARLFRSTRPLSLIATLAVASTAAACSGGGSSRRPVALPSGTPTAAVVSVEPQALFEAGRYQEAITAAVARGDGESLWFAAHSSLRLGQPDEAALYFRRMADDTGAPAWQAVSALGLALLADDGAAIDQARAAAEPFTTEALVQFQLGLAHVRRNDSSAAAAAFDRCTTLDPGFAYAYYNAALVYDRLRRTDLTIARLEAFERLAPDAPERPEVASLLSAVRRR